MDTKEARNTPTRNTSHVLCLLTSSTRFSGGVRLELQKLRNTRAEEKCAQVGGTRQEGKGAGEREKKSTERREEGRGRAHHSWRKSATEDTRACSCRSVSGHTCEGMASTGRRQITARRGGEAEETPCTPCSWPRGPQTRQNGPARATRPAESGHLRSKAGGTPRERSWATRGGKRMLSRELTWVKGLEDVPHQPFVHLATAARDATQQVCRVEGEDSCGGMEVGGGGG